MHALRNLTALLLPIVLALACRSAGVPHPELTGCHPACPGAPVATIGDARATLASDAPRAAAPSEPGERPPSTAAYLCPMHPHVGADEPARCPECGMRLVPRGDVLEHDHDG